MKKECINDVNGEKETKKTKRFFGIRQKEEKKESQTEYKVP